MSPARLEGRIAVVTGAGQGVGRGIALALAADGAAVALLGRTEATLRSVAAEIVARGGRSLPVVCDVTEQEQVVTAVAAVRAGLGPVDVLVNNAQSIVFGHLEDLSVSDLDVVYRSGPIGAFHTMQECLPDMKAKGAGNVVNLATSSALIGEARFGAYAMAKEAMRALSLVAATEWGPYGIRVNCVCPSAHSPSYDEWAAANPERAEELARARPLGRMGDPELDIGRAVSALVGDDMRYLTGATLMLNGGRVYLS